MNLFLERLRRALAPDYTVAHQVGAGGMGTVFLGRDVSLDVPIAIKVMRPEQLTEVVTRP